MGIGTQHFNFTKVTNMKINLSKSKILLLSIGISAMSQLAYAAEPWVVNASTSVTRGAYSGSVLREALTETGIMVAAESPDVGGVTVGYGKTWVQMKNTAPTTNQNNLLLAGRVHIHPEVFSGRLTTRIDVHRITNNDATGNTDNVKVLAPQVSWLSSNGSAYADMGFSRSNYENQLTVNQYTPTLGFGFNERAEWVQLRGYLIRGLNPSRAAGKSNTSAVNAKWTHFFASTSRMAPSSLTASITMGEQIYAVDMDAQSVSNLGDVNKGAASLGLTWNVAKSSTLMFLLGQSKFRNVALLNDYSLNVGYLNFSTSW